jgi:hypothetical protein
MALLYCSESNFDPLQEYAFQDDGRALRVFDSILLRRGHGSISRINSLP